MLFRPRTPGRERSWVRASLRSAGRANNLLFVFASDHGELLHDHGLVREWERRFDASIRVALVVTESGSRRTWWMTSPSTLTLRPRSMEVRREPPTLTMRRRSMSSEMEYLSRRSLIGSGRPRKGPPSTGCETPVRGNRHRGLSQQFPGIPGRGGVSSDPGSHRAWLLVPEPLTTLRCPGKDCGSAFSGDGGSSTARATSGRPPAVTSGRPPAGSGQR